MLVQECRDRTAAVQTPQSPEAVAHVLHLLKRRSFRVREAEVRLPADGLRRGLRLDFLLACRNQVFGAEVKAARRLADWLFHSLALPILALQAARRLKGWEPLLAIHVEALERRSVERFKAQVALYAPELWWLLADAQGHVIAHLPGGDEEAIEDRHHGRRPAAPRRQHGRHECRPRGPGTPRPSSRSAISTSGC